MENLESRAEEIFTVVEYDGQLWLSCNNTGVFPFSFLGLHTEEEIIKLISDIRTLYIETEKR